MKLIKFIFRHMIPIAFLAAVGMVIFSAASPAAPSRVNGIGVDLMSNPPVTQEVVEGQLNAIQQSGAKFIRIEVNWSLIESVQDTYDWSNVMPLDLFFTSAKSRGLQPVAVITGFPVYLSEYGANLDQKTVGERWEKFITAAVNHFGEQVDYWQIGDQINSSLYSRSLANSDPDFYAKMLISASKIIKRTNAGDEVWMGSLVSATANICAVNPLSFLLEINGAKAWNAADVITYQPRRGATAPENPSVDEINPVCSSSMPGDSTSLSAEVQSVQDLARQLGGKNVYITGLTWSQDELLSLQAGRAIDSGTLQSDLLVRATAILVGNNSIPLVFWEVDPLSQPFIMSTTANLTTIVGDSKSLGQTQGQTGNVQEYSFQKGADLNALVWRSQDGDAAQPVRLTNLTPGKIIAFSSDAVSLTQVMGTTIDVDESGSTVIMLNERPVILLGKTGGWDDQVKSTVTDQLDEWRSAIRGAISDWLNQQKASALSWLEGLFSSAKDSAVNWGEEKINEILN